jgi:hypothetical protein
MRETGLELRDTTLVIFGSPIARSAMAPGDGVVSPRALDPAFESSAGRVGASLQGRLRRMAAAKARPFRIGADVTCTDGVCGRVTRGVRGLGAVDAAGIRPGPGRAFRRSFDRDVVTRHG